jgi:hypothetical protein
MEIEAYKASIVFRDWEDSLKETIYYEHLQKGDKSSMSTKNWKNGEIKSLLAEAWGFGFNLENLSEERTGSGIDHGGRDDKEAEEETEGKADSKREEEGLEDIDEGGAKKGDQSASRRDYAGASQSKKDKEEREKYDKSHRGSGARAGDQSNSRADYELKEDSGYEEKEHDEHNAWSDEDHIDAIEKHLRALRHDRDYEEDHESLEEGEGDRNDDREQSRRNGREHKASSAGVAESKIQNAIAKIQKSGISKEQLSEVLEKAVRIYKGNRK